MTDNRSIWTRADKAYKMAKARGRPVKRDLCRLAVIFRNRYPLTHFHYPIIPTLPAWSLGKLVNWFRYN